MIRNSIPHLMELMRKTLDLTRAGEFDAVAVIMDGLMNDPESDCNELKVVSVAAKHVSQLREARGRLNSVMQIKLEAFTK